jgi:hypothetical protein
MKNLLARILCSAAQEMWNRDKTLGNYTSETEQHELNLAFHFACELRGWFPWLDCDFDVSKRASFAAHNFAEKPKRKRPDIILHRRSTHFVNFIVIEVKRKQNEGAVSEDIKRIRHNWMVSPYDYFWGASVAMADDQPWFRVRCLSSEDKEEKPTVLSRADMGKPLGRPDFSTDRNKTNSQSIERLSIELHSGKRDKEAVRRGIEQLFLKLYSPTPEAFKIVDGAAKQR